MSAFEAHYSQLIVAEESKAKTIQDRVDKIVYRGVKKGLAKATKKVIKSSGIHISYGKYTFHIKEEFLSDLDPTGQTRLAQRVAAFAIAGYDSRKQVTFASGS